MTPAAIAAELGIPIHRVEGYLDGIAMDTAIARGWFEVLLTGQVRRIDVANPAQDDTSDLMAEFMAIVYSFSACTYGLPSAKRRTAQVRAILTQSLPDLDEAGR